MHSGWFLCLDRTFNNIYFRGRVLYWYFIVGKDCYVNIVFKLFTQQFECFGFQFLDFVISNGRLWSLLWTLIVDFQRLIGQIIVILDRSSTTWIPTGSIFHFYGLIQSYFPPSAFKYPSAERSFSCLQTLLHFLFCAFFGLIYSVFGLVLQFQTPYARSPVKVSY